MAHEVNHELNQLLRLIATDDYLHTALEYELKKKTTPNRKAYERRRDELEDQDRPLIQ